MKPQRTFTRIHFVSGSRRPKPKAGDRKTVRGVEYVRQFARNHQGYLITSNGRYVYEWVRA